MADRSEVLAFAAEHGPRAASRAFNVPYSTIASWRRRQRQRETRQLTDALGAMLTRLEGGCVQCGGSGRVTLPAVTRNGMVVRAARVLSCPNGCDVRRVEVTAWPKDQWEEFMRAAGDLGAGWTPEEWARIQAGELHPHGSRWTHHDRLTPDRDTEDRWVHIAQLKRAGVKPPR